MFQNASEEEIKDEFRNFVAKSMEKLRTGQKQDVVGGM